MVNTKENSHSTHNAELHKTLERLNKQSDGHYQLEALAGDLVEINMGPHHPSTHGVIRFVLHLDGEVVVSADADVGYLHRAIEKIAEQVTYGGFAPYTDRIDYVAALNCNVGYAHAVETLAQMEIPERAVFLRIIGMELNRIASHLMGVGALTMDIGAFTPFTYALRERESIFDLLEEQTGARLTYNYARIGGVSRDVSDEYLKKVSDFLDHFVPFVDEFQRLIGDNKIFVERLKNIGIVSAQEAKSFSFSGPNLRASGVDFDFRKKLPYHGYENFDFKTIVSNGFVGTTGDSYDRYYVRVLEMLESVSIIRQALAKISEGSIRTKVSKKFVPPAGEIYSATEAPRGELGFYLVSDGKSISPQRLKIRTGSFAAMTSISKKLVGMMVADVIAYFASLDVVAPEVDR